VTTLQRPFANTYWVIPNLLLAGEYPGDVNAAEARQRLDRLQQTGITSFVDLTEEGERPPYRHLLADHADYLRSPIVDSSVPNNVSQTQEILATVRAALASNKGLYVHCRAGIGRTGLIVGCFLADEDSNGKSALKTLNQLWLQSERAAAWPRVPQTAEQADYVRHWPKFSRRHTQRLHPRHFDESR
jgi:hypothetical protein